MLIRDKYNVIPISMSVVLHAMFVSSLLFVFDFSSPVRATPLAIEATLVSADSLETGPPPAIETPEPEPEPDTSEQERQAAEEKMRLEELAREQKRIRDEEKAERDRQAKAEAERRKREEAELEKKRVAAEKSASKSWNASGWKTSVCAKKRLRQRPKRCDYGNSRKKRRVSRQ